MRCKQGDLAIIIGSRNPEGRKFIGSIVKCVEHVHVNGIDWWMIEPGLTGHEQDSWSDQNLRPIGNPGEDAVDQMLLVIQPPQTIEA